jgi:hypothetical protein
MLHLTVDPTLFGSGLDAYQWVRQHRGIGGLVRNLKRKGVVLSGRYFCVIEFHNVEHGGWPHWHILVEASFVDVYLLQVLWGRLRPKGIPLVKGRPPFGIVRVTAGREFTNRAHAANYATKYVIKPPKDGWPQWVREFDGRIPRYSASRGFWGTSKRQRGDGPEKIGPPHPPECFCEQCREGINPETGEMRRRRRTIAERVAGCGKGTMLFCVRTRFDEDGELVEKSSAFVGHSMLGIEALCQQANLEPAANGRAYVNRYEMKRVVGEFTKRGVEMAA